MDCDGSDSNAPKNAQFSRGQVDELMGGLKNILRDIIASIKKNNPKKGGRIKLHKKVTSSNALGSSKDDKDHEKRKSKIGGSNGKTGVGVADNTRRNLFKENSRNIEPKNDDRNTEVRATTSKEKPNNHLTNYSKTNNNERVNLKRKGDLQDSLIKIMRVNEKESEHDRIKTHSKNNHNDCVILHNEKDQSKNKMGVLDTTRRSKSTGNGESTTKEINYIDLTEKDKEEQSDQTEEILNDLDDMIHTLGKKDSSVASAHMVEPVNDLDEDMQQTNEDLEIKYADILMNQSLLKEKNRNIVKTSTLDTVIDLEYQDPTQLSKKITNYFNEVRSNNAQVLGALQSDKPEETTQAKPQDLRINQNDVVSSTKPTIRVKSNDKLFRNGEKNQDTIKYSDVMGKCDKTSHLAPEVSITLSKQLPTPTVTPDISIPPVQSTSKVNTTVDKPKGVTNANKTSIITNNSKVPSNKPKTSPNYKSPIPMLPHLSNAVLQKSIFSTASASRGLTDTGSPKSSLPETDKIQPFPYLKPPDFNLAEAINSRLTSLQDSPLSLALQNDLTWQMGIRQRKIKPPRRNTKAKSKPQPRTGAAPNSKIPRHNVSSILTALQNLKRLTSQASNSNAKIPKIESLASLPRSTLLSTAAMLTSPPPNLVQLSTQSSLPLPNPVSSANLYGLVRPLPPPNLVQQSPQSSLPVPNPVSSANLHLSGMVQPLPIVSQRSACSTATTSSPLSNSSRLPLRSSTSSLPGPVLNLSAPNIQSANMLINSLLRSLPTETDVKVFPKPPTNGS